MRSITKWILTSIPLAVVGGLIFMELPNLRRYLKIRKM